MLLFSACCGREVNRLPKFFKRLEPAFFGVIQLYISGRSWLQPAVFQQPRMKMAIRIIMGIGTPINQSNIERI
jgi:hypothetical protein